MSAATLVPGVAIEIANMTDLRLPSFLVDGVPFVVLLGVVYGLAAFAIMGINRFNVR